MYTIDFCACKYISVKHMFYKTVLNHLVRYFL